MKKEDKLRKQRYDISMRIINLETKEKRMKLTKNELSELDILRDKEIKLNEQIKSLS